MSINDKIGLGTVQFGLKYGINNTTGQIAFDSAKEIARMYCGSVPRPVFDTASAYGSSESVLGRILNDLGIASDDTVISKFSGDILTGPDLRASFERTIGVLGGRSLYAFIAHDAEAVRKGQGVLEELIRLKEDGRVRKIGISAYFPSQVEWFLERKMPLDLVQVPYNVFDRRFEPFLAEYAAAGIEVHTRSAFLQGLFFRSPDTLPDFFDPVKDNLSAVRSLACESGLSLSKLLLLFCLSRPDIDRVIIGVDSEKNMQENLFSAGDQEIYDQFREKLNRQWHTAENILLPFNWPKS